MLFLTVLPARSLAAFLLLLLLLLCLCSQLQLIATAYQTFHTWCVTAQTCPARTYLIMSWKAFKYYHHHHYFYYYCYYYYYYYNYYHP